MLLMNVITTSLEQSTLRLMPRTMSHHAFFIAIPYLITVRTFVLAFAIFALSADTIKGILLRVGKNDLNVLIHPGRRRRVDTKIAAALAAH